MPRPAQTELLSGNPLVVLVSASFALIGLLLALMFDPITGWTLLASGLAAVLLLARPRMLLACYWGWSALGYTISSLFYRRFFGYFDEMFVAGMLTVVLGEFIINRRRDPATHKVDNAVVVLLVLSAVSGYFNHVRLMPALRFLSAYLGFLPVFYLSLQHLRGFPARRFFLVLLAVMGIQVVLNTAWLVGVNPLPNFSRGTPDFAIGTMGGCDLVAYFTLFLLFALLPLWRRFPRLFPRLLVLGLALVLLFQFYITFTNHAYLLLAGGLALQIFFLFRDMRLRLLAVAGGILLIILLAVGSSHSSASGNPSTLSVLSPSHLAVRFDAMLSGTKGQVYYNVFCRAPADMPVPLLGAGPGNFGSAIGVESRSALAEQHLNYFFLDYSGRMQMYGSSITQNVITGVIALWSELGVIGFLYFFGLHVYAMRRVWRQLRRGCYRDRWLAVLAEAFIPSMATLLVLSILTDIFTNDLLGGGIWIWAALVWKGDHDPDAAQAQPTPPAARLPRRRAVLPNFGL